MALTNYGGTILVADAWQPIVASGAVATQVTIQNTSVGLKGYNPLVRNDGPLMLVWPFATDPRTGNGTTTNRPAGQADGALTLSAGDTLVLNAAGFGTATIYVRCAVVGATFAVGGY